MFRQHEVRSSVGGDLQGPGGVNHLIGCVLGCIASEETRCDVQTIRGRNDNDGGACSNCVRLREQLRWNRA